MKEKDVIDYTDKSLYKDTNYVQSPLEEKKCYTPEEAYEHIMSDVKSIYDLV